MTIPADTRSRRALRRSRCALRALGWIFLAALPAACGDSGATHPDAIVYRLVDAGHRHGARIEPPTLVSRDESAFPAQTTSIARIPQATLGDDTRPVLTSHAEALLAYQQLGLEERPGSPEVSLPLGVNLPGASDLVLVPQLKLPGRHWQSFPARLVAVAHVHGQRMVTFELPAELPRGGGAQLHVVGHRPPGKRTVYETAPLAIPRRATLEFALGILEPAEGEGPVRFSIEACRAGDCEPLFEEALDPGNEAGRGWQDRRVALSSLGGEEHSLRFVAEHVGAGAFTLPVWGNPTVVAPGAAPDPRPSVVLLSIDTLRADHLDLYGYGRETAPFLRDRIAARGVVFERLVAEAATTDPSHMTMFTSLPALVHGVECCLRGLAVPVVTLAEVLRASGYRTAAFTEDGPLDHARGFALGFDRYVENKSVERLQPTGQVARTFEQARRWLEAHPEGPSFLFLHTFQVHAPYEPPVEYRTHYLEPPPGEVAPQARPLVDQYDREIRYVDDELALLHGWMEARGLGQDTIWIVLSDHGEEFYEHGSLGHGTLPYQTVLRVPLVVQGPGIRQGVRDTTLLHHLDLMPTVLDLVGAEAPRGLRGESFAGLLRGPDGASKPVERPAFSATWVLPKGYETPALSVRVGDRKLIRYRREGREHLELYDLAADPGERRNLAGEGPADLERMRGLLDRHEQGAREWRRELGRGGVPDDRAPPLDPDREEMLRNLGYIE